MTQNLFEADITDQTKIDPEKNYLEELVGEGKKFKTEADLARGKYESDLYVKTLERQLDSIREEYLKLKEDQTSGAKLDELYDLLKNNQPLASSEPNPQANEVTNPPLDIDKVVSSKIAEHERAKQQKDNFDSVMKTLKETYGNNYVSILKERTEALGLTQDFINDLARNHPSVLLKTLDVGVQNREDFQAPPHSAMRNDNFTPRTQKRSWSFYQDMKRKDPKLYYDPKTQVQMHKDAIALGTDFEDGDFRAL